MSTDDRDITRCPECGDWRWELLCRTCLAIAAKRAQRITGHVHLMDAINERQAA